MITCDACGKQYNAVTQQPNADIEITVPGSGLQTTLYCPICTVAIQQFIVSLKK